MTESLLNFALVPDASFQDLLDSYQQSFVDNLGGDFTLFGASAHHITVCQVRTDQEAAKDFFSTLAPHQLQDSVNLSGLTFLPSSSGSTWVEISVLKSKVLSELQDAIVDRFGSNNIQNDIGDLYRPHLTLGKYKTTNAFDISLPYQELRAGNLGCKLRVGTNTHFEEIVI